MSHQFICDRGVFTLTHKRSIIDAHTHVLPDKIAEKGASNIGAFYTLPHHAPASVSALTAAGDSIGVYHYLTCSTATVPEQVEHINDFLANIIKNDGRFTALIALHPDHTGYEEELDRGMSLGLAGVKMHPDFQRFDIDEERLLPIYRAIARRGLPLLIHLGDIRYDHSRPSKLAAIMKKVPDLTVIAPHFTGYQRWQESLDLLPPLENLWIDTSSSLGLLPYDMAMRLIEKHGVEKFMFGTDFPIWNPVLEVEKVERLALTEDELDGIFQQNFKKLFKINKI